MACFNFLGNFVGDEFLLLLNLGQILELFFRLILRNYILIAWYGVEHLRVGDFVGSVASFGCILHVALFVFLHIDGLVVLAAELVCSQEPRGCGLPGTLLHGATAGGKFFVLLLLRVEHGLGW